MESIHGTFFKNLKVIELASVLAGPSVGRFFAECGAQVIKIEPPANGDVTRSWKLKGEKGKISAYYASVNSGKTIEFLDIKDATCRVKLDEYFVDADIVLMNFKTSSAAKMNLLPEQLRAKYPQLIIGQIDAFHADDDRPAYDIVLQAEAGYLSMCGTGDSPARLPVAFIDLLAGHQLKEGILMALLRKQQMGDGAIVRVNLLDAAIGALINQASNYLMMNHLAGRMGTLHPNISPYGECFRTADNKEIVLAIGNDNQFKALLKVLELPENSDSQLFHDNASRVKNRAELYDFLKPKFQRLTREDISRKLINAKVPYGSILSIDEVLNGAGKHLVHEEILDGEKAISLNTVNLDFLV